VVSQHVHVGQAAAESPLDARQKSPGSETVASPNEMGKMTDADGAGAGAMASTAARIAYGYRATDTQWRVEVATAGKQDASHVSQHVVEPQRLRSKMRRFQ
jgi:hypothetical protein